MMVLRKRMTFKVGGGASIHREGAPETQGSWGNPPAGDAAKPSRQVEFLRKGNEEKASYTLRSHRGF